MSASDFDAIEAAVMETERGRWFLDEFARRRRAEDTARVLASIDRLEARMAEAHAAEAQARLEAGHAADLLRELAEILRQVRPEMGALASRAPLARLPPSAVAERKPPPPAAKLGELEGRLAALARLDALDDEKKLNWLG